MTTLLALLKALPQIVQLLNFLSAMVHDREQQGIGRTQAIAEALAAAHEDLALADAAQAEADMQHAKDPSDNAFLPDFRRSD